MIVNPAYCIYAARFANFGGVQLHIHQVSQPLTEALTELHAHGPSDSLPACLSYVDALP